MLLSPPTCLAGRGFYYNSISQEYRINPDKTVTVRVALEVVNMETGRALTGIQWTVPSSVVEVRAWDERGGLSVEKEGKENQTVIGISFRSPLYAGQSLKFWLEYVGEGMVHGAAREFRGKFGGFQAGEREVKKYIVQVTGPPGSRLFLTSPLARIQGENILVETCLKAGESFEGISVVFYYAPIPYRVSLTEDITNRENKESTILLDILLYNLSQSQFAALYSSSHTIESIYRDEENNWHACYKIKLGPQATESIKLELLWICDIHSPGIGPENSGKLADIPPALYPYLDEAPWWEVNNPSIQQMANLISKGETNIFLLAQKIIQGVGALLEYKETELRQGALRTLQQRVGDCDGYSDLTIALARASGLPARLCIGWVVKENNSFGGHAWVEFYTPTFGWQPADPTWAENWGDYLFRSDPVRLLRGTSGLTSSGSSLSVSYFGLAPSVEEKVEIRPLDDQEVLPLLLQACDLLLRMAGKLTTPENLLLKKARDFYELARAQGSTEFARRSIEYSNQILSMLGKRPVLEQRLLPNWIFILILLVGAGLVTALYLRKT